MRSGNKSVIMNHSLLINWAHHQHGQPKSLPHQKRLSFDAHMLYFHKHYMLVCELYIRPCSVKHKATTWIEDKLHQANFSEYCSHSKGVELDVHHAVVFVLNNEIRCIQQQINLTAVSRSVLICNAISTIYIFECVSLARNGCRSLMVKVFASRT